MYMNRYYIGVLFSWCIIALAGAQPPVGKGYELVFEDNFDGDSVNTEHWSFRVGRRTAGNYINGMNLKENVRVENGFLYIDCRHEEIDGKMENTGGGIITKANFGYGYYECKSKPFMKGRGVHTSFWQSGGTYPNSAVFEIDSHEIDSKCYLACNNLYVHLGTKEQTYVPWPHRANLQFTTDKDGWWIDGYEYTPEGVTFYDNGKVVAQAEWDELNAAQRVWLSALNGCGKVDTEKLPGYSVFDYFRFYTKDYPGINLLSNGNFEFNQDLSDPYIPKCWKVEGTPKVIRVASEGTYRDKYKVRFYSDDDYQSRLIQQLTYIMDGDYMLSAMVRSSGGQKLAEIVASSGGQDYRTDISSSSEWKKIELPVKVVEHAVTIELNTDASGGQWLEFDDINFMKPVVVEKKKVPFRVLGEAIWSIADKYPIHFSGNGDFYFFDRCVGLGKAITVDLTINADCMEDACPISRMPKDGKSGWAIGLTKGGGVVFQIGSLADHTDVYVPKAYMAGKDFSVRCVYNDGVALVYINGKLMKKQLGITHDTLDKTAPGRMGAVEYKFNAANDVIVEQEGFTGAQKNKYFRGCLKNVNVFNKAKFYK